MPKEKSINLFSIFARNPAGFALEQYPNSQRGISHLLNTNPTLTSVPRAAFHQTACNRNTTEFPGNNTPSPFDWRACFKHFKTNFKATLPGVAIGGLIGGMVAGFLGGIEDEKNEKTPPQKKH